MKEMYEVYVTEEIVVLGAGCSEDATEDEVIAYIREWAQNDFEAGHPLSPDDYAEFALMLEEEGYTASEELFDEYFNAFDNAKENSGLERDEYECDVKYSYELRKVVYPDDIENGEETFRMSDSGCEEYTIAYDTLDDALELISDDISNANIRMPGTGIKVVAINDVSVPEKPDKFLAWTEEELKTIRDAGGNA